MNSMELKRKLPALLVIGLTFIVFLWLFSSPSPVYCEKPFVERSQQVVMFSTPTCHYCKKARSFFRENNVSFCEYDVRGSEENRQVFYSLGGYGVPLIIIGEQTVRGFNLPEIVTILQL